jgi:hypothetical protein
MIKASFIVSPQLISLEANSLDYRTFPHSSAQGRLGRFLCPNLPGGALGAQQSALGAELP